MGQPLPYGRGSVAILVLATAAAGRTVNVDCAADPAAYAKLSETAFAAGDTILLKRGGRCSGPLAPKGSGEAGRPVRIGAYGEGPLPVIDGGKTQAALQLADQEQWEIENVEVTGGEPYGVRISATAPRRHFVLRNVVVHDVGGTPKKKESGLVVFAGPLLDVLIDGVTAYRTTQWAGIYVSGSAAARARDVTVRNSIVHDVDGDGIVLFRTENGRIEKSAAWRTGLQERETIGTPNAIWTWSCRNCVVENCEGFWIDSPGVDGGVYDIDWGNDDNVVQYNYAHDAMGYCAAIFGAGKLTTTNSVLRYNVCVNNGRSPKLARRQGDIYTSTWEGGSLDGIRIEHNTVIWNPPIDAPAVQMSGTGFTGSRPNIVSDNVIYSTMASMVRAGPPVKFERNVYWRGLKAARWSYGGVEVGGFDQWRTIAPTDQMQLPDWRPLFPSPALKSLPVAPVLPRSGKWRLVLRSRSANAEARSQLVFLQAALAQYPDVEVFVFAGGDKNLPFDWNFGEVRRLPGGAGAGPPMLMVISPEGVVMRGWEGFVRPAELGLALKRLLGGGTANPPLNVEGFLP